MYQQALSCLFPVLVFSMLALSHLFANILPRYDFMLIACLSIQAIMYYTKIETKDEVLVICIFHLLGLLMELFKVHFGSWTYPELAYTKLLGVPLYSGFMYASVASYMCQAWRRLNLQILNWPSHNIARIIGALIYLNFFSNHFIIDVRYAIGLLIIYFFRRSVVVFYLDGKAYRMPTILSFLLIGFFIWLAENLATSLGAWKYAYQHNAWAMVNYQKISSWGFLVIVSFIIVAELKTLKSATEHTKRIVTI
ncbi:Uncharacterized membrane protein YoaT, DUF817 family [Mucilaginibacter pineti]|uniref:Uncharacterized membrane protein YoaT, DUF817 family n=1 Tax=Mucilaginibacter pineti TaxID=1391627 RepID=A0A1G6YNX2_9SPHI|nr:Uncharacterized membrane protein YoaT, DUF817 family [Mucilaginibacter pineti]